MNNKILIVDDDPDITRLLKLALQQNGYSAIVVFDAVTAIKSIKLNKPALVILDISMPGHTGIEVVEFVANNKKYAGIPIIILTGSDNPEYKIKVEKLGVLAYIKKPFDVRVVLGAIMEKITT